MQTTISENNKNIPAKVRFDLKDSNYAWSLLGYDEFEDDLTSWLTDYINEGVANA